MCKSYIYIYIVFLKRLSVFFKIFLSYDFVFIQSIKEKRRVYSFYYYINYSAPFYFYFFYKQMIGLEEEEIVAQVVNMHVARSFGIFWNQG